MEIEDRKINSDNSTFKYPKKDDRENGIEYHSLSKK